MYEISEINLIQTILKFLDWIRIYPQKNPSTTTTKQNKPNKQTNKQQNGIRK